MSFEKKVPEWNNAGTEPSESLKKNGFVGGYKPPASVFNWFWHSVSEVLKELQGATPSDFGAVTYGERQSISEGANLNDLVEIGGYGCIMTSTAETLANCPVKSAFILDVINSVGGPYKDLNTPFVYLVQRLMTFDGIEYIRSIYVDGSLNKHFTTWQKITWKSELPTTAKEVSAMPFFLGTVNGTDFTFDTANSLGTYGVSWVDCPAESSPKGVAGTVYGTLLCHINNGYEKTDYNWLTQIFIQASNTSATHDIYVRRKINADAFTAWDRIALASDYQHGTKYIESGNLNDLKEVGYYFATGSNTCTNTPTDTSTTGFGLEVKRVAGSLLAQICTVQDIQYIRYFNGSTWQAWRTVYNSITPMTEVTAGYAIHPVMNNCSNSDINELKSAGFYYGYQGMLHAAATDEISVIEVISYSTDWLLQRQTRLTDGRTWCRYFYSGTSWSDWYRLYTSKDKPSPTDIGAANTAFSNIPDISAALKNIRATDNFKGTINGTDYTFNTALTQGEYSVSGKSVDGAPYTGDIYGKLVVLVNNGGTHDNSTNWIWQVFYSTLFNRIYFRTKINSGSWSEWGAVYNTQYKPSASDIGAAASSHTQAANTITAGTFAGTVYANRGDSGQAAGQYLVRNSKLASAEENPTVNGEINWTYK